MGEVERRFRENGELYSKLMVSIRSLDFAKQHFEEIEKTDLQLKQVFHNMKRFSFNQSTFSVNYLVCNF